MPGVADDFWLVYDNKEAPLLHPMHPEPPRDDYVLRDILLPRVYPRTLQDQAVINDRLKRFELVNAQEIRAGLARRITAAGEMLATLTHNLSRVQVLYQQVTTDRERMLAMLNQLEDENNSLRHRPEEHHAGEQA